MTEKDTINIGFLGECMVELKGDPELTVSLGFSGDSLNTAVYFSRCSRGTPLAAEYLTAVGTDALSLAMLNRWRAEGIGCRFVRQLADKLPGVYFIHVNADGERSFSYWREQSAARSFFEAGDSGSSDTYILLTQQMTQLHGLYLSGISLATLPPASREKLFELLVTLKANGGKVYFDNNFRSKLWPDPAIARDVYTRVLALCDIAFLTLEDESALFGSGNVDALTTRLAPLNIPETVIKCGADDCVIVHDDKVDKVPALKVAKVVDTTAAGDAFSAAYLAARLKGEAPLRAAQAGHTLAATVIQHRGAIINQQFMPTDIEGRKTS